MKPTIAIVFLLACIVSDVIISESARILAIVPTPSYSHQIPFHPLWKALSQHGHEIVLVTSNPMNDSSLTNLTEIDIYDNYNLIGRENFISWKMNKSTWHDCSETALWSIFDTCLHLIYQNPELRKAYAPDSNVSFDLVFAEVFLGPGAYAFAHRFNCPLIGLASMPLTSFNLFLLGAPVLSSHASNWELTESVQGKLSFWQRLHNFYETWIHIHKAFNGLISAQQEIAERYLGKGIPNIADIYRNISAIFVNQQDHLFYAQPLLPNVIKFSFAHVTDNVTQLPEDLKLFLGNTTNGFIYFSLGTNARGSFLPKSALRIFFDVFSNLPYKVIWKYEKELPWKHDNVFTAQWLPQKILLDHPKIKLFIYQGGLQSTEEAVYYTVPTVGIPIIADQIANVHKLVSLGVARHLNLNELTKENLEDAIYEILNNKGYKERLIKLKERIMDRPYNDVEHLVWWSEYVIRHKGAPHLRSSTTFEPWYQKYDIDVIVFLGVAIFIAFSLAVTIIYKIVTLLFNYCNTIANNKKVKVT